MQPLVDPGRDLGLDVLKLRRGRRRSGEHELIGLLAVGLVAGRGKPVESVDVAERDGGCERRAFVAVRSGRAWVFTSRTSSTAAFIEKTGWNSTPPQPA